MANWLEMGDFQDPYSAEAAIAVNVVKFLVKLKGTDLDVALTDDVGIR